MLSLQCIFIIFQDFIHQHHLLLFINIHNRFQELKIIIMGMSRYSEGLNIFRKTAAAVTNAGKKEAFADPIV
ncbi:hypothetical protein D9M68_506680 [compost metagenome]